MTSFNGTTMTYDADGNLTSDGTNSYFWDARGHLIAVTGTNLAAYQYDAFGRRVQNTMNGAMTQYLYDGQNPVEELDGASPANVTAAMLTGLGIDEYFARTDSNGTMSYLTSRLGSTVALSSSSGTLATQYSYEPYGATTITGSSANPFQFTGRENDGTGLYYYRARYYSSTLQRFISQDPLGFGGGEMNLYSYTADDPSDLTDPQGTQVGEVLGPVLLIGELCASNPAACKTVINVSGALAVGGEAGVLAYRRGHSDPIPFPDPRVVNPGRDSCGNCNPCPPNKFWVHPGNKHGSTSGSHWHGHVWHQDKDTCECYAKRVSGATWQQVQPRLPRR